MEQKLPIDLPESLYPQLSDAQLVLLTQVGMTAAYNQLVTRYRGALCVVAAPYVGCDRAQDVAQDAFLIALNAIHQLEDGAKFGSWLRMIARHRAARVGSRASKEIAWEPSDSEHEASVQATYDSATLPDEALFQRERNRELWRAMDALSETHREVILLHHLEEWPLSRMAVFLSVSEDVVRGRLFRARVALRRLLQNERK